MPHSQQNKTSNKLKILPLGGVKEIGMNMLVVEYNNDVLIVDAGFMFPKYHMFGIDYVIPDMSYLEGKQILGLLLTHGHEDHIGAIPFLLRKFPNITIYGTKLTLAFLKAKSNDYPKEFKNIRLKTIHGRDKKKLGKYFSAEFMRVNHSIPDGVGIAITTPHGVIIHTGDFKIDLNPINDDFIDLHRFASYGENGVLLLMSDSTNVEKEGFSLSESNVFKRMNSLFSHKDGMIIVATFASSIERIQDLINASKNNGKLVALSGRNLIKYTQIARDMGYLHVDDEILIPIEKIYKYPREKLVCITTGTQGEPYSSLALIAANNHRHIKASNGDVVIFSSSVIPGNEMAVTRIVNDLVSLGVTLIDTDKRLLHVSGHASSDDLRLMCRLVRPKYFMPLHGEKRHLIRHIELVEGLTKLDCKGFLVYNGDSLEIDSHLKASVSHELELSYVYVDGKGVGDVEDSILSDRLELASNGVVFVTASIFIDKKNQYDVNVAMESKGFVYSGGGAGNGNGGSQTIAIFNDANKLVIDTVKRILDKNKRTPSLIKYEIRETLKRTFIKLIGREPVIFVALQITDSNKNKGDNIQCQQEKEQQPQARSQEEENKPKKNRRNSKNKKKKMKENV